MIKNGYRPETTAAPARVLGRNLGQLGNDVLTLVELQAELLQVDLRDWAKSFVKPVVALVMALVIAVASLPVLLMALGYLLSEATDLSLGVSMLIAAAAGLLTAGICVALAVMWLKSGQRLLQRFRTELRQNIAWLKQVLSSPTTATPAEDVVGATR